MLPITMLQNVILQGGNYHEYIIATKPHYAFLRTIGTHHFSYRNSTHFNSKKLSNKLPKIRIRIHIPVKHNALLNFDKFVKTTSKSVIC